MGRWRQPYTPQLSDARTDPDELQREIDDLLGELESAARSCFVSTSDQFRTLSLRTHP